MPKKPYLVAITGGSASGKSHFLKAIKEELGAKMSIVAMDNYYWPREQQQQDEQGFTNFDLPDSIDHRSLVSDVHKLLEGETISRLEYTYNNPAVVPETISVEPKEVIILEGIFSYYYPDLQELIDLKIFIDAKEIIKINRRISRDGTERGYDLNDVLYRYQHHVTPVYNRYIEPLKDISDLVIPNNDRFDNALDVVITYLKTKIQ